MAARTSTVVIVTSPGCPTCNAYKMKDRSDGTSRRDRIVSALNSIGDVKIIEIDVPTMKGPVIKATAEKYHPQLANFIRWFPILLLFNSSFDNPSSQLQGVIYGAREVKGTIQPSGGLNMLTAALIKSWVESELSSNSIFTRSHAIQSYSHGAASPSIASSSSASSSSATSSRIHSSLPIPSSRIPGSVVRISPNNGCFVSCDGEEADLREW